MEALGEVGRAGNLRVFVGLALPVNIGEALGRALHAWKRQFPEIAWEEPEALHLTLQFVGSYPAGRLAEMEGALQGVKAAPFRLRCAGTGAFPHARRPRVAWAGVERTARLMRLAEDIQAALSPLGVVGEERPFTPHISLARVRPPRDLEGWAVNADVPKWGEEEVREFQLFQTLSGGPRASRYAVLRRFEMSQSR